MLVLTIPKDFDNKINIQPISSFARCACPDHELMPETIVRYSYILRQYIHGHNRKGKSHSEESKRKMVDAHKKHSSTVH